MAIPNTNTFSMTDVLTELRITGTTSPMRNLVDIISDAPNISYDPTYAGSKNSLSNFRNYNLISGLTGINTSAYGIASDGTNMWTVNYSNNSVTKITPAGGMTTYTGTGNSPTKLAFDGTNMWTVNNAGNSVTKITPAGGMTTYAGLANDSVYIAFDGTYMWVVDTGGSGGVTRVTPTGGMSRYAFNVTTIAGGIAFDGTNMWVVNQNGGVIKVTFAGSMTYYSIPYANAQFIAHGGAYMWIIGFNSGNGKMVTRVDSSGGYKYLQLQNALGLIGIAFGSDYMWITSSNGYLTRIGAV